MKALVLKTDVIEAMSIAGTQNVQGGMELEQMIVNTSGRPTTPPVETNITKTVATTLYTKGSCPTCMTCPQ